MPKVIQSDKAGRRLGQEGKPVGQVQWGMRLGTGQAAAQFKRWNAKAQLKCSSWERRWNACNKASAQLWHGCFHSHVIQGYSTTAELALGMGNPSLYQRCVQRILAGGTMLWYQEILKHQAKSVNNSIKHTWQLSEKKILLKNQMPEVKKKNNPVLRHNLGYIRRNWNIYGLGKFTCEEAASDS